MHELSLAMSIIDLVEEERVRRGGCHVDAVHVRVGQLAGIVEDALRFSYECACADTELAGSRLVIEEAPAVIQCPHCGGRRRIRSLQSFCCEECGAPATEVVSGRELVVTALEVRT